MKTKLRFIYFLVFIFLISFSKNSFCQFDTSRHGYVDFHIHTTMKRYFTKTKTHSDAAKPELKNVNWNPDCKKSKIKNDRAIGAFTGFKSYSQATYDLLANSDATILCTSVTPIEKKFASDKKVWIKLSKYLFRVKLKMSLITRCFGTRACGNSPRSRIRSSCCRSLT